MRRTSRFQAFVWAGVIVGVLALIGVRAQEQPDPLTLLPAATLAAIANEVSGAQAYDHVIDAVGYERDRTPQEYGSGTFHEAVYLAAKAREYGLSEVTTERFPQSGKAWDGEAGELWIEQPGGFPRLLTRYRDIPATLASGSRTADVRAEAVFAGRGDRESDYTGKDVKGKIVLVSGSIAGAHSLAVGRFEAAGVLSYANSSGKPIDHPDQIQWSSIVGRGAGADAGNTTFGFQLSHRMGMELLDLITNNPKVVLHAVVKASEYPLEMPAVIATIPGDGSIAPTDKNEVVFVGHLFEGTTKQGANDNCSGPAVQLEIARAWLKLVKDGVLPRPRRTIRFMWVPEISGSRAYLLRHPDVALRVLAAINMDMVGQDQTKNKGSLHLDVTPYSLPSFVNDVSAHFMEFVGDTNREKIHNRRIAYAFQNPIIDPRGSHDPFWYHVEKFYGSSDHTVFLDFNPRIPAVMFGNWPDAVYHTSDDTTAFMDPTQLKRMAFIGLSIAHVLATTTGADALNVAALSVGSAERRIGGDLATAVMMLGQSKDARGVASAYKEALNLIRWAHWREAMQVRSVSALIGSDKALRDRLSALEAAVASGEATDVERVRAAYLARCTALGVAAGGEPPLTSEEQAASRLVPRATPQPPPDPAAMPGRQPGPPQLPGFYALEARAFADGTRSVLDIRNAISAEFGPVRVDQTVAFFRELEKSGAFTVEERTGQPVAKKKQQ